MQMWRRFGGSVMRRAVFLAAFPILFASLGVTYAAISATDLAPSPGDERVLLGVNTFVEDPDTTFDNADVLINSATSGAAGGTAPGVEATSALPGVNTARSRGNYAYTFEVKETGNATWQAGEDFRIRVFSDDGGVTTLEATLYLQQAVIDDGSIDGVTVIVDLGSTTTIKDRYDIIVDRQ